jgi:hypothetical protein
LAPCDVASNIRQTEKGQEMEESEEKEDKGEDGERKDRRERIERRERKRGEGGPYRERRAGPTAPRNAHRPHPHSHPCEGGRGSSARATHCAARARATNPIGVTPG